MGNSTTASLGSGVIAALVGLLVFLVAHHLWIKPIWFIIPAGLPIAVLGGLALGWSYIEVRGALWPAPWTGLAVCVLLSSILLPSVLLSFTHGPLFDVATAKVPPGTGARVAVRFTLELLVTSTFMGALAGRLLGHSTRATLATALAGLAFAIGPGHNIPMFGTNPRALKGIALVVMIVVASSFSLVAAEARLVRR